MVFYVKNEESSSSDVHVCVALYAEAVAQIVIAIYDTVVVDQAVHPENESRAESDCFRHLVGDPVRSVDHGILSHHSSNADNFQPERGD